jgi:DNA replication protein DnaC
MTNLALIDSKEKQEACSRHGIFTSTETAWKHGVFWSDCPICEDERQAARRATEAEERKRVFAERFGSAVIPFRFSGKTLASFEAKNPSQRRILSLAEDYVSNFEKHYDAGHCMILCGQVGTGKTLLACGILRGISQHPFVSEGVDWRKDWHPVRYATCSEIIRSIRATWRKKFDVSEADAIRKFTRPHLLVIDELGRQFGSDAEKTQLEELIDMRYQEVLPTIVVTNVGDKSQLASFLGERGLDRLRETGGIMAVCDWASHRGEQ